MHGYTPRLRHDAELPGRAATRSPASSPRFRGEVVDEVYRPPRRSSISRPNSRRSPPHGRTRIFTFMPGGLGVNLVRQYRQAGLANIPFLSHLHGGRGDAAGAGRCGARLLLRGTLGAEHGQRAEHALRRATSRPATTTSRPAMPRRPMTARCCWTAPSAGRRQPGEQGRAARGDPRRPISAPCAAPSASARTTTPCRISGCAKVGRRAGRQVPDRDRPQGARERRRPLGGRMPHALSGAA